MLIELKLSTLFLGISGKKQDFSAIGGESRSISLEKRKS
jgi:hypothetical protein